MSSGLGAQWCIIRNSGGNTAYLFKGKKTHRKQNHPVLAAALSTIARTQKQHGCPSAGQWIEMRHLYSMGCCSAGERTVAASLVVMWIHLDPAVSSKSERKKQISLYVNAYIYGI